MKSNKQRREEIKQKRIERSDKWRKTIQAADSVVPRGALGTAVADVSLLSLYNNSYNIPRFYLDKPFTCKVCRAEEVWTAKQQKWWYEVKLANINSQATHCRACRLARRAEKAAVLATPGASLLKIQSERLRQLAQSAPNDQAMQEIESALNSKWWGMRELAIATLGAWAGDDNIARLKSIVNPSLGYQYGSWPSVASCAAIKALVPHLQTKDADWALDVYLSKQVWLWHDFFKKQSPIWFYAKVVAELKRNDLARLNKLLVLIYFCTVDSVREKSLILLLAHHNIELVKDVERYLKRHREGAW